MVSSPSAGQDPAAGRKVELAKIHMAKAQLGLDDDTYRQVIRVIGGAESGSAADLTPGGRERVLSHFRAHGWRARKRRADKQPGHASDAQIAKIRALWLALHQAAVVRDGSEEALRSWVRQASRRYHPAGTGYSAPELLPASAAGRLIEQLKSWAARTHVE